MSKSAARSIHVVGSVPFSSADEVFQKLSAAIGPQLKRIPDGETGARINWIMCQAEPFKLATNLEVGGERQTPGGKNPRYKLKQGKRPEDVDFPPLGYSRNALESYAVFKSLKDKGKLSKVVRFQVCLPTPLAVAYAYFVDNGVKSLWPAYERKLLQELDEISAAIPHHDLAIQWDVCPELHAFMEIPELIKAYPFDELVQSVSRLCNRVPNDAEVGLHFCYGDSGHQHNREPSDMGNMVKLFDSIAASVARPLNWVHMPVPKDRTDDAYFAPLAALRLPKETELYLGLIHLSDGLTGATQRTMAAQRYAKHFGVATECGFGRRPPETIVELLKLHKSVAEDT